MSEKTAIEKMVEFIKENQSEIDAGYGYFVLIKEARRLALEEAKEKPEAPASLVEELEKLDTVEVDDEIGRTYYYYMQQVDSILSRYRPSPKADIVGELKEYRDTRIGWFRMSDMDSLNEIIAKFEGAK